MDKYKETTKKKNDNVSGGIKIGRKRYKRRDINENIEYYCMMAIPILIVFVFQYMTAYGMIIGLQDYVPGKAFWGKDTEWVGLKWIRIILTDSYIWRGIRNSIRMFGIGTIFMFASVAFAIITNEIRNTKFQGVTRLLCYLPNFVSEIVVCGLFCGMLGSSGVLTIVVNALGFEQTSLLTNVTAFPWIYTIINTWQTFGWGSLLYTAAIAGIDPGLYEAAKIDGAGRLRQIWHITLSSLKGMIVYGFIMRFSGMLSSDVTQIIRMYNPTVYETADTIGSYVYRETLIGMQYSYGTAVGYLTTAFNLGSMVICNKIARKFSEYSLW